MSPVTEFDEHRRRRERERERAGLQAKRELLLGLVGLADAFDRALALSEESPESAEAGLRGMRHLLRRLLDGEGVTPFESLGQPFDPTRHEAIATIHDVDGAPGSVVEEAARGYLWSDELLRPARVRVAQ